jgi:hypothetical protein
MGKHYVPQRHLRRFEIDYRPGFVWMYDKKTGKWSEAAVSKVAQQADYFSPEVEKALAQVVEHPGNVCIDKLISRIKLDNTERSQLALYMMIMATRGPGPRKKLSATAANTVKEVLDETRTQIEEWIAEEGDDCDLAKARLKELEELESKYSSELPTNLLAQIREPFWSKNTVECILNMGWHILPAPKGSYFVTSDSPAHFFEGIGLGTPLSEFTFPISKEIALIGEHVRPRAVMYERAQSQIAKEVNRRILSKADRFVFSPKKEVWIETVSQKTNPYLCQIRWVRK